MRKHPFFRILIGFFSCLFLISCNNKFEKLEADYYTEHYIEAATLCVTYYSDKELKPKIDNFIHHFGERLVRKAIEEGDTLSLNTETNNGLNRLHALETALESMETLHFSIPDLPKNISKVKTLFDERKKYFIAIHYAKGIEAYNTEHYQRALDHFNQVSLYNPTHRSLIDYQKSATHYAQRRIAIYPFYQKHMSLKEYVTAELFPTHTKDKTTEYVNVIMQGLNVSEYLPKEVQRSAEKKSSEYMHYFFNDPITLSTEFDYDIKGILELKEHDYTANGAAEIKSDTVKILVDYDGVQSWETGPFQYEVFKSGYTIDVNITLYIIDSKTQTILKQFLIQKTDGEEVEYRGRIIQKPDNVEDIVYPEAYLKVMETPIYINKRRVLEQVLDQVADDIADQLNTIIDTDEDPLH